MRKTPLKRGTKQLKRTPIKFKPKRNPIPKEELARVDERADGECEWCSGINHLEYAHIVHRGMGGSQGFKSSIINNHRNIARLCQWDHVKLDNDNVLSFPRDKMIRKFLKDKIGWYEWYEENKEVINR
jgi:hypothetical protein